MSAPNQVILDAVRKSAGQRIAVLFSSFFILMILSGILGDIISRILPEGERTHLLVSSILQCIFVFCVPAFLVARFSDKKPVEWLHLNKLPSIKALGGVIVVFLISMPAMEWLIEWNSNLHLPESMGALEATMRKWEENAESTTKILLDANGFWPILAGVAVIGILTGISEELFFRGGFQNILIKSSLPTATAVWVSALLFSFMHFQFFGFVPRLLMGVFFGYLLVWTRSLWVPVFAHVLNNSMVVLTSSMSGVSEISNASYMDHPATIIASIISTAIFLFLFRDIIFKNRKASYRSSWQRSQLPPISGK